MLNGMESDNITYQVVLGNNDELLLQKLVNIYSLIFEDADVSFFIDRFKSHPKIVVLLALNKTEIIGFKIGYPYNENTFYSWVGGVLPNFRQKRIASTLAKHQEQVAESQGYSKLRTKSMNRFKPMMILNLKNGFDIVQVYTNDSGQTKVVFEKKLL